MDSDSFSISRRAVLAAAAGFSVAAASGRATAEPSHPARTPKSFPKDFHWGVATAGHQIEGNNTNSDYWFLENVTPTTFVERSGDACDSYHRYEQDIALLARLGFNSYRFSLEWARIEPSRGAFSIAQLDYYKRVIECCRNHKVAPVVTFYHCTGPSWFAAAGGWLSPEAGELFARYCSTAARALAPGMDFACTINEPQVSKTFRAIPDTSGYFGKHDEASRAMHKEAARASGSDRYVTMAYPDIDAMTPQLIAAHKRGVAAIKAERAALPVGVTLNVIDFQPGSEESAYEEIREKAYGEWLNAVRSAGDFVGVQAYRQLRLPGKGKPLPPPQSMPFVDAHDEFGKMARPEALGNAVEYIHAQTNKPILVTENGLETENDERRIWYIDAALAGLHEVMGRGVPVLGYIHWSLLDNFEWERGYKPKFGLCSVDRTTFERKPKPSAAHLGDIARRNAI